HASTAGTSATILARPFPAPAARACTCALTATGASSSSRPRWPRGVAATSSKDWDTVAAPSVEVERDHAAERGHPARVDVEPGETDFDPRLIERHVQIDVRRRHEQTAGPVQQTRRELSWVGGGIEAERGG